MDINREKIKYVAIVKWCGSLKIPLTSTYY